MYTFVVLCVDYIYVFIVCHVLSTTCRPSSQHVSIFKREPIVRCRTVFIVLYYSFRFYLIMAFMSE